ncbi:MAG: protein phosphatase 2C domain-containing protein [Fuerstiella sp.]
MSSSALLANSSGSHCFNLPQVTVTAGAYSVRGRNRDQNEDYQYISPEQNVFVVADGMGGHQAGEFASRFVVDTLTHELRRVLHEDATEQAIEQHVQAAFEHANCLLLQATQEDQAHAGAGSTATLALLFGDRLLVSGIGDSRAYLLRAGTFERLTQDDSMAACLQRAGVISEAEAKVHPMRNRLCAFMGMEDFQPDEDIRILQLQHGDVVLLCSDGLTDVVADAKIQAILQRERDPQLAAQKLVQTAVEHKAKDDVTCVVFQVDPEASAVSSTKSGPWFRRLIQWLRGLSG